MSLADRLEPRWTPPPTDGPNTRERMREGLALTSGQTKGHAYVDVRDPSASWSINEWREWRHEANEPQTLHYQTQAASARHFSTATIIDHGEQVLYEEEPGQYLHARDQLPVDPVLVGRRMTREEWLRLGGFEPESPPRPLKQVPSATRHEGGFVVEAVDPAIGPIRSHSRIDVRHDPYLVPEALATNVDYGTSTPAPVLEPSRSSSPAGPAVPPRRIRTGKDYHGRKMSANHVPRPRNAFILFRSHACSTGLIPPSLGVNDAKNVSKLVGAVWRGLSDVERKYWEEVAAEEKRQHAIKYPNYKFTPKKKTSRRTVAGSKRRSRRSDQLSHDDDDDIIEEEDEEAEYRPKTKAAPRRQVQRNRDIPVQPLHEQTLPDNWTQEPAQERQQSLPIVRGAPLTPVKHRSSVPRGKTKKQWTDEQLEAAALALLEGEDLDAPPSLAEQVLPEVETRPGNEKRRASALSDETTPTKDGTPTPKKAVPDQDSPGSSPLNGSGRRKKRMSGGPARVADESPSLRRSKKGAYGDLTRSALWQPDGLAPRLPSHFDNSPLLNADGKLSLGRWEIRKASQAHFRALSATQVDNVTEEQECDNEGVPSMLALEKEWLSDSQNLFEETVAPAMSVADLEDEFDRFSSVTRDSSSHASSSTASSRGTRLSSMSATSSASARLFSKSSLPTMHDFHFGSTGFFGRPPSAIAANAGPSSLSHVPPKSA